MKSTNITRYVAIGVLVLFALFSGVGSTGLLLCAAIGLILFGVVESLEITAAVVVLVGLAYRWYWTSSVKTVATTVTQKSQEGFESSSGATNVVSRLQRIKDAQKGNPVGVFSSSFVEGFADKKAATSGSAEGETSPGSDSHSASSKPAPDADANDEEDGAPPAPKKVKSKKVKGSSGGPSESFSDSGAEGLFRLGELPTESKSGPHIDQGTTLLNALNSLDPGQINSLNKDSQDLLQTQQNLNNLLNTMKPLLQSAGPLLQNFNQMFGGKQGGMPGLPGGAQSG